MGHPVNVSCDRKHIGSMDRDRMRGTSMRPDFTRIFVHVQEIIM